MAWHLDEIPDLSGKVAVVTGGNVGLGFRSGLELARKGAQVVLACRNAERGREAAILIKSEIEGAEVSALPLDLVDAESIEGFARAFAADHGRLDILLNNGGVVNLETLVRTIEGREMHMATNHLGHFALTGRLAKRLLATQGSRVVTVSSGAHRAGEIVFDDLDWRTRDYDRVKAYGDSKLANLLFTWRLQRYFEDRSSSAIAVAAHPGLTGTERQQSIGIGGALTRWLATPVVKGVRPQLLAATDPSVRGGDFYGPRFGLLGPPIPLAWNPDEAGRETADRLWRVSEELTGVRFPE